MTERFDRGFWSTEQLPPSWTWVDFADFWTDYTSSQKKLAQQAYLSDGKFPVVDQGQDLIGGFLTTLHWYQTPSLRWSYLVTTHEPVS